MHIAYQGKGYLVFVIGFFVCLAANLIVYLVAGESYWDSHAWPLGCALIVSGILIKVVQTQLVKESRRVLIDEQTGERVVLPSKHQFFFIPMKWWGILLIAWGIIILAGNLVPGPYDRKPQPVHSIPNN